MHRTQSTFAAVLAAVASLIASAAVAQTPPPPQTPPAPPPPPHIEAKADFSYVGSTGNSNASTTGIGGQLILRPDGTSIEQRGRFTRSRADGTISAQSVVYSADISHVVHDRVSLLGTYSFLRDTFAGLSQQHLTFVGASIQALKAPQASIAVRLGPGFLYESKLDGSVSRSAIFGTGVRWSAARGDGTELHGELETAARFNHARDWRATHSIELVVRLTRLLSLKLGHVIRYRNVPVPTDDGLRLRKRLDTQSLLSLTLAVKRP